ncbi:Mu-like prophage major head subunit gpT family protein [Sphingomonas sp.]|jgi:phage major head subunit gpT-like protein|uniref:Mu-like prophage major head subunit gpT family protein n=1 Tax=Sphingomonas sp. TaxID=28214 RepID=UPI002EDA3C5B
MIITSAALGALRVGFSTLFSKGLGRASSQYEKFATIVPSTTREQRYGWLGKIPSVREWLGARVVQNISESDYSIREKKWELTVGVDRDDIETDNLGTYAPLFEMMGESTGAKWDELVFGMYKLGFQLLCYDGQYFFDTDHPVLDVDGVVTSVANTDGGTGPAWFLLDNSRVLKPIILQKRKDFNFVAKDKDTDDNVFGLNEYVYGADARANVGYGFWQFAWGSKQPLTPDNYEKARVALMEMKGDYGRPLGLKPDTLVVPPRLERSANKIIKNEKGPSGEDNEFQGTAKVEVVAWLA